jgi:hypothetical protein
VSNLIRNCEAHFLNNPETQFGIWQHVLDTKRELVSPLTPNRSLRCHRGLFEFRFDESTVDVILLEDKVHHPFLVRRHWVLQKIPPNANLVLVGSDYFGSGGIVHKRHPLHAVESVPDVIG